MPSLILKRPFPRIFNASGAAGPRRLMVIGGGTVVIVGAMAAISLSGHKPDFAPTIAKMPKIDPLPGGAHTNPEYSQLAKANDQEKSAKAAAIGESSLAHMPGSETAVVIPKVPQGADFQATPAPAPKPKPASVTADAPAAPPPVVRVAAQSSEAKAAVAAQQKYDDNQGKAYQAAINGLFAGWGSRPQLTEVILQPQDRRPGGGENNDPGRADTIATNEAPAQQEPGHYAKRVDGRASAGHVLMPAGRGIYARTLLASSSDQGGPVVVEAESGPIAGDRMTGSFEAREERLVIHLDTITLQDGTQQKIDALVTAPETMETSVASSVDEHYLTRFVLPVAAAFVSGLGQAIAQSNSTVVAGPLGGATAFQKLNIDQQLGVAAGAGAAQFGAAVKEAAPRGPTVKVDANVNVGVMFLSPLIVGG